MSASLFDYEVNLLLYAYFPHKRRFDFETERFDFQVMFICENGRFEYAVEGLEAGTAQSGDAVICPSGRQFNRRILEPVSLHVIRFDFIPLLSKVPPVLEKFPAGKFRFSYFDRIKYDFGMLNKYSIVNSFLPYERHFLLDVIYCAINQFGLLANEPVSECEDPEMSAAVNEIKRILDKKLTVKSLAADFGLTPVAFIRRFKKAVGKTPMNYIITLRMQTAVRLLSETKKPISEISEILGYDNEYYFSNSFKRYYSQSPSDFRNTIKV